MSWHAKNECGSNYMSLHVWLEIHELAGSPQVSLACLARNTRAGRLTAGELGESFAFAAIKVNAHQRKRKHDRLNFVELGRFASFTRKSAGAIQRGADQRIRYLSETRIAIWLE